MPRLIRVYIQQVLIGFALSGGFVALLLWQNVANLWHLVTHTSAGPLAVFLLWLFSGIVFAGVQFGIRIMTLADNDDDRSGGKRLPVGQMQLVPVRVAKVRSKQTRQLRR